ncbi:MAG TPA: ATPase [Allosphingosinicella sp.]|jgi:F-type H+-transporting ATPase subunit b
MPQIDQISEIFASQLFWLIISFGLIYVVIGRGMLPKIEATVEARDQRIAEDLAAAERARAQADEAGEANRLRTEQNRAEALKVTQAAKEASARETERKVKAADAEIGERVALAEARIRSAADAALTDIETVAADITREMVAKLSGAAVTREQAAQAVKQVTANG